MNDYITNLIDPSARRSKRRAMVANLAANTSLTRDDEQGIVGGLRDKSVGTLSAIGNVLDLPGSMVRDTLSGRNPLDQLLSPTSSDNRTSGRQLARQYGMAGRRDTWGNAIGGFATEVALDPLTYMTFGGSALSKAGQAAKGAGLMNDVGRVAARKAGQAVGTVGKRQSRVSTTLDDMARFGVDDTAKKARSLIDDGFNPSESLGGSVGIGLPFQDPSFVLGTGPRSQRVAAGMDAAGQAVRFAKIPGTNLAPVDATARLFDVTTNEAKTPFGQAISRQHFNDKQRIEAHARGELAGMARQLGDAGKVNPTDNESMRDALENVLPMEFLHGPERSVAEQMKRQVDEMPEQAQHWGVKLDPFADTEAAYFPRRVSETRRRPGGRGRPTTRIEPRDVDMSRKGFLADVPGGTGGIAAIARDQGLEDLIESGANVDALSSYIGDNFPWLPDTYRSKGGDAASELLDGRHRQIANWLAGLSPETRKSGVFGNSPVMDFHARRSSFDQAIQGARTIRDALAEPGILSPSGSLPAGQGVRVGDFIGEAGLQAGDESGGFLARLGESLPGVEDLTDLEIRREHADDLRSFMKAVSGPEPVNEIIGVLDDVTNLSKAMWTGVWPAFHVRNLLSGQVHNKLLGMGDASSVKHAHSMLKGGIVPDARKIKAVQDEWVARTNPATRSKLDLGGGSPVDADSASQLFETRGRGVQYHGARGEVSDFSEGYYNPDNIYGASDTFYTTDAMDVAAGYGRKNDGAKLYRIEENAPVRFFDMEERLPPNSIRALMGDSDDVVLEALDISREEALGKGETLPNLREVMDVVREISQDHGLSKDSVQEIFDGVSYNLQSQGFGGMSHMGGLKTKRPAHNVKIYFNPKDQIRVVDTNWAPASATVSHSASRELTDEEATKILGELAYKYEVLGKFDTNSTAIAGEAQPVGGQISDVLTELLRPGSSKVSAGSIASKAAGRADGTSFLPWEVRGVGGRDASTFGPAAAGEEIGHYVEGLNRVAPFLNQLRKGVSPEEAAKRVGAAQVLYSNKNFTPFERQVMRRVAPFYSFTSRTAKRITQELMERPGGRLGQTIRASNAAGNNDLAPDYVRDTAPIPTNGNPILESVLGKAPTGTDRYITGFGLMHEDPLSFGLDPKTAGMELMSRLNPVIKGPLEMLTRRSFHQRGADGSGRRLESIDPTIGRLLANVSGSQTPVQTPQWLEQLVANSPASVAVSKAKQLTDTRKRFGDTMLPGPSSMLNFLTGVRVTDVSPEQKQRTLEGLIDNRLQGLGGRVFERRFIPADAQLTPEQRAELEQLRALQSKLSRERRQASENAQR